MSRPETQEGGRNIQAEHVQPMTAAERQHAENLISSIGIMSPDQQPTTELGNATGQDPSLAHGLDRLNIYSQGPHDPSSTYTSHTTGRVAIPPPEVHQQAYTLGAENSDAPGNRPENAPNQHPHDTRGTVPLSSPMQDTEMGVQTPRAHQASGIFLPSPTGQDNTLVRTPIMVTPEVARHNVVDTTTASKAASFRVRGLAPLRLEPEQIQDARYLRNKSMEFAALSHDHYIPQGMNVNDIIRLYIARNPHELLSRDMIYRLVAAQVLELKKLQKQSAEDMQHKSAEIDTLKQTVHDMQMQMDAYNAEYEQEAGGPHDEHPQAQHPHSASGPSSSFAAEVQKLTYMSRMGMFEGHLATPFRSWQEWSEEFLQRAVLVCLGQDHYYAAAVVQLAQQVRDAWIAHTKNNPGMDNWASLQEYMQVQYAPLDKSAEAEKRFMDQKMSQETEQALQTFSNIQIRNITEMGEDSSFSSKGLWDHYMSGLYGPLSRSATTIYSNEQAIYDALTPIARITKMQERLMPQLRTNRSTHQSAEASRPHVTGGAKRVHESDAGEHQDIAQPTQKAQRYGMYVESIQPQSSTYYSSVPHDKTPETCPDVGYQSDTQAKPYNAFLKQALIQERKCLACWQPGHGISTCPNITPDIASGMNAPPVKESWSYRGRGASRGGRYGNGRGRGPQRGFSGFRGRSS